MSNTEPTLTEQLAQARQRRFEAELETAKAKLALELAHAQHRAAHAEARATYAERRLDHLEGALARQNRNAHDRALGLDRFQPNLDEAIAAAIAQPDHGRHQAEQRIAQSKAHRAAELERLNNP